MGYIYVSIYKMSLSPIRSSLWVTYRRDWVASKHSITHSKDSVNIHFKHFDKPELFESNR